MKIIKTESGRYIAEPETPAEKLALEDLHAHRPYFAVAEEYQVNGFIRGYQAAMAIIAKAAQGE